MKTPVLYIPIGLPGSGKSTYLSRFEGVTPISGDSVRKELFGDESLQYSDAYLTAKGYDISDMDAHRKMQLCNEDVWNTVRNRVVSLLSEGKSAAYDGINGTVKTRAAAIQIGKGTAVLHGIYFAVDAETSIARDAARKRRVGRETIYEILSRFTLPSLEEGFDILDTVDENGTLIQRITREESESR
ncbi:MAG: ATP-binding protein [Solobacterium sp.]|nr:ATP-binding protein [Solobacterium sp.]